MNTTQTLNATVREAFSPAHMSLVVVDLQAARVIMRTVTLALRAEEDGKVSHGDKIGPARWSPATAAALTRLKSVRDICNETPAAPALDWATPLILIDALDSALFEGYCSSGELLTNDETSRAMDVIIEALDDLLDACADESITTAQQGGTIQ